MASPHSGHCFHPVLPCENGDKTDTLHAPIWISLSFVLFLVVAVRHQECFGDLRQSDMELHANSMGETTECVPNVQMLTRKMV